jgi:hypothetical protein
VRVLSGVATSSGQVANLYRSDPPKQYARLVPSAAKISFEKAEATVLDARFPTRQLVLLDPNAPIEPEPLTDQLPAAVDLPVEFEEWRPGYMRIRLDPAAPREGFLLISENHYPAWRASVDGAAAPTLRGNGALLTVPVGEGAREVELEYVSGAYSMGKAVTLLSVALTILTLVAAAGLAMKRRSSLTKSGMATRPP